MSIRGYSSMEHLVTTLLVLAISIFLSLGGLALAGPKGNRYFVFIMFLTSLNVMTLILQVNHYKYDAAIVLGILIALTSIMYIKIRFDLEKRVVYGN
jgi:hypothetical protein